MGNGVSVIVGGTGVRVGILVGMGETVGVHAGVDEAGAGIGVGPVDAPLHPASNEMTNIKPAIVGANGLIFMTLDPREWDCIFDVLRFIEECLPSIIDSGEGVIGGTPQSPPKNDRGLS